MHTRNQMLNSSVAVEICHFCWHIPSDPHGWSKLMTVWLLIGWINRSIYVMYQRLVKRYAHIMRWYLSFYF